MADRLVKVVASIPLDSNVPEDAITNTWHFDMDDTGIEAPDADVITAADSLLTAFYTAIDATVFALSAGTSVNCTVYDMRDPTPRVPIGTFDIPLAASADGPMPHEVAICLSYKAEYISGQPNARRRGRIYLGPIPYTAGTVVASQLRPSSSIRTTIATAADTLVDGVTVNLNTMKWAVYSPTTDATGSIDDAFHDVVGGWIDDAFDTQRKRGAAVTARTTFP